MSELNGKCLLVKDLTALFTGKEEITKNVLGQMVGIYDGSFARFTGTRGKVEYEARLSFMACITPKALQKHSKYIAEMGSRLLFYRVASLSKEEEEKGMDNVLSGENRKNKIEKYRRICSSYVHDLLTKDFQMCG